jgi:hypothetical protein
VSTSESADTLGVRCKCDRGDVIAAAFQRQTSLLVRRIEDMGYPASPDWRCADCIADMAEEVAAHPLRGWHPDFGGPGMTQRHPGA